MSLNPRVCKKSYKVHIPMMGEACEFWLITVTDEQSITNPDKDHAYLTDDGKLFVFNGDSLVRVNCDICFTQEEREKLEGIEEGANKYVLPVASSTELGGVLLGYTQNGRNYPITKDTKGNIYVNVPWEEYQLPKATDNALGGIKTGYKQNGKFYPIKTDTDGNAYVQVPWEDTNTVYEVVSKTSNGLMPMLPSDENASKRFLNGDGEWVVGTDNSINGVTQTGSTFSGETSDCGVQILEVQGKTVQQTTQGYQLFDASKLPTKTIGGATLTNNGDGSFTISGSGNLTENFSINHYYSKEETLSLLKAGTLKANGLGNVSPNIIFGLRNKNTGSYITGKSVSKIVNSCQIEQSDLDSLGDDIVLSISMYTAQGTQITGGTIKPMIYIDGDGTWEPFTGGKPAPNPDYPMPIENVEITKIVSSSKNIIANIPDNLGHANCTYLYNEANKMLTIKATGNDARVGEVSQPGGSYKATNGVLYLIPKNAIKVYFKSEAGIFNAVYATFYDKNKVSIGFFIVGSYTIPKNAKYVSFRIGVNPSTSGTWYSDRVYASFEEIGEYIEGKYNEVETSLTLAEGNMYENGVVTRKMKETDVTTNFAFSLQGTYENTLRFDSQYLTDKKSTSGKGYCNLLPKGSDGDNGDYEHFRFSSANKGFVIYINKSRLETPDVNGLAKYLNTAGMKLLYELDVPTTEEFKVPTIPSYEPYTEISTNSVVDPTITFRPLPFTTCLVGEATEEESGYMPPLSGNSNEFLNGSGEWSVPSGYTLPTASSSTLGGVKIGENITISSGTISIDKEDVTGALGYTPPTTNTTYSVATTSKDGLMSSTDKTKLTNLRRIWKGTSSSPPSGWVDGDIYVQYEE